MASNNAPNKIDYVALLQLTQKTGMYVACGTLFYKNGYRVMMNNKPNTKFKFYNETLNGVDTYTNVENIKSKYINRDSFLIIASDKTNFKVTFEDDELVQCYRF